MIKLNQLLKDQEALPAWKESDSIIKNAFDEAMTQWQSMRDTEGKALKDDFNQRILTFRDLIKGRITCLLPRVRIFQKLIDRLNSMNLEVDLEDDRVLKEIALFADRSDITEELTRLKSHFSQFKQFTESPIQLDENGLLCIEMFREMNTISSKTQQIEVTKNIIEGKNELERIREQVQNIE